MPPYLVTRPKDELISQKERPPIHLPYQIASPATGFRCNTMRNIP